MIHGAERRTVAKMATHQPQFIRSALQKLRGAQAHVLVRRAVKAVSAHGLFS